MNPFHVLDVPATASRAEVERAGQKWLSMLELGVASARQGPRGERTPEAVRTALAELRDPEKRLRAELTVEEPVPEAVDDELAPWPDAFEALR